MLYRHYMFVLDLALDLNSSCPSLFPLLCVPLPLFTVFLTRQTDFHFWKAVSHMNPDMWEAHTTLHTTTKSFISSYHGTTTLCHWHTQ
jgi:hypothetical protein